MLPDDLHSYLSQPNRCWEFKDGEVRKCTFHAVEDVPLEKFSVSSDALHSSGQLSENPQESREFEGYDLLQITDGYDPDGILIWFPEWGEYGSWDCDHHTIITYPGVTWTQISKDPTWYVNGQFYPNEVEHRVINPWAEGA